MNGIDYNLIFLWLIFLWDGRLARPGLGADKMSTPQELCRMQMQTAVKIIYTT
ncbi:MAG: hypothetical protein KME57_35010 [Scytonema hyalinum WJT4-NPBG1]|nr:hypothetical protein [Scytonema hyalinum WJT4-NPBG1]